jgi:alpha-D-ribose 1-methylphosphonate 5-triphosphate synthase subunit PhnL
VIPPPGLRLRGLRKSFTQHLLGGRVSLVLDGVDLDVAAGECVVLQGPSGSGKSTLLRCVYGGARADSGSILVRVHSHEVDVVTASPRAVLELRRSAVGLATQFLEVVPRVAARDLVAQKGVDEHTAAELLRELGLPDELHDVAPATFSGGQRQMLNLALTLARPRPVLLLDEVTAALDPARRETALRALLERKRSDVAILAVFHDLPRLPGLVDRVVTLRDGVASAA